MFICSILCSSSLAIVVARSFAWQLLSSSALGNVCRNAAKYEIQLVLTTLEKDEQEQERRRRRRKGRRRSLAIEFFFEMSSFFNALEEGILAMARRHLQPCEIYLF